MNMCTQKKQNKNKTKYNYHDKLKLQLKNNITKNHNKIWLPSLVKYKSCNTNSCYSMKLLTKQESEIKFEKDKFSSKHISDIDNYKKVPERKSKSVLNQIIDDEYDDISNIYEYNNFLKKNKDQDKSHLQFKKFYAPIKKDLMKSRKNFIYPKLRQRKILQKWYDACTHMYNTTVKYIKSVFPFKKLQTLKNLSDLVKYTGNIGEMLVTKIDLVDKEIKQIRADMSKLLKCMKFPPIKKTSVNTKCDIKKKKAIKKDSKSDTKVIEYNKNMKEYCNQKNNLREKKMEKHNLENRYRHCKAEYEKIDKSMDNILQFENLRTNVLKKKRDIIAKHYLYNNDAKTIVKTHILDCAIKQACTSFKSAKENYLEGNIKKFRIRYWKKDRRMKIMEIEAGYNKDGNVCGPTLGNMLMKSCESSNKVKKYELKPRTVKIHYDSKLKRYIMLTTEKIVQEDNKISEDKYVGIDPGIRKFVTCISNDEAIKYGENMKGRILKILKRIDKNNGNKTMSEKAKFMINDRNYKRIKNIVDEMHWKIIKYLTENNKRIYIGKLNIKSIVSKEKEDELDKMTKRVGILMRHGQFRERLKYKCSTKRIMYVEVDERFTSKTCSVCGEYKEDLGRNEVYDCGKCGNKIDRDINGCRCITLKNSE